MPDMSETRRLGTPLPRNPSSSSSSNLDRSSTNKTNQPRAGSPLKQASRLPSEGSASPTVSAGGSPEPPSRPSSTDRQSSSTEEQRQSSREPPATSRQQPTEAELKARAAAAVAKTRIRADPSMSSAFKKDQDPELYELFVG
ncbi:hypothetical protein RTBOTA2_002172 [Rhodotorula toruloides]|uniref:Uncharacterized protein n=1 Tax=Rhodotorula toruloides TaxID=5286 RepID=A0A2T0AHF2_RHOTO|nr:hypothetical protein RTBOTA2_002172 [Rhodotorula toruloides]PRQ77426.1 hypothetical protein AAT19DRAFT_8494 [Rhodotorula toruloides]